MPSLTLVSYHLCPYAQRAAIMLMEKGVPFERVMIDLGNKPDWFRKISPRSKVPLLRVPRPDGGEAVIFESSVICEYIEETRAGPKLHPRDPLARARHRAWIEFASAILGDIWGLETTRDPKVFETKRRAVAEKFAWLEGELQEGPYFAGAGFGLVDAAFAPVFRYFDVFDSIADLAVLAEAPRVRAWRAALAQRPSVRAAVDPDYGTRLAAFLERHEAHLLKLAA